MTIKSNQELLNRLKKWGYVLADNGTGYWLGDKEDFVDDLKQFIDNPSVDCINRELDRERLESIAETLIRIEEFTYDYDRIVNILHNDVNLWSFEP